MTQESTRRESTRDRLAAYASIARIAPAVPLAIPSMMLVAEADATVYSQTGLSVTIGSGAGQTGQQSFNITGAGGSVVGVFTGSRVLAGTYSFAKLGVRNGTGTDRALFSTISQGTTGGAFWFGGLPVNSGATWGNPGRNTTQFKGAPVTFGTATTGGINFGSNGGATTTTNFDPQGVGNTGQLWYLLFKFTDGAASGDYGWISFTANVNGFGSSSITITGWGWDDSGATIGAGVTASAVPGGTGLAALAIGAAGLRGRRRGRN